MECEASSSRPPTDVPATVTDSPCNFQHLMTIFKTKFTPSSNE